MRQQPFKSRDILVKLRGIGRRVQIRRKRHRSWYSLHMQVDRHIVSGGDVGKQQKKRMVWRGELIRSTASKMFRSHFTKSRCSHVQQFFSSFPEFSLYRRLG